MTTTPSAPTALSLVSDPGPADCECTHSGEPCSRQAAVRVTVVCQAEGCNCAAAVYLLCHHCLAVWTRRARRDGIRLRVKQL
jgi:hypothetical protein